jgi:polyferredoxin
VTKETPGLIERRVAFACVLALIALGLIVWSLVDPAPLPVIGAMTVGQLIGTLSLLFFLFAIVADLRPALARLRVRAGRTAAVAVAVAPEPTGDADLQPPST